MNDERMRPSVPPMRRILIAAVGRALAFVREKSARRVACFNEMPPTRLSLQAQPPALLRRHPDRDPPDYPALLVQYLKNPAANPDVAPVLMLVQL